MSDGADVEKTHRLILRGLAAEARRKPAPERAQGPRDARGAESQWFSVERRRARPQTLSGRNRQARMFISVLRTLTQQLTDSFAQHTDCVFTTLV